MSFHPETSPPPWLCHRCGWAGAEPSLSDASEMQRSVNGEWGMDRRHLPICPRCFVELPPRNTEPPKMPFDNITPLEPFARLEELNRELGRLSLMNDLGREGLPVLLSHEDSTEILQMLMRAGFMLSNNAELGVVRVHRGPEPGSRRS